MTDLSSIQAAWLSKYVRESWHYQEGKVYVKGNITITDCEMKELPFIFGDIEGVFKLKGCTSLISVKGMPENTFDIEFENCAFETWVYTEAMRNKKTMEDYLLSILIERTLSLNEQSSFENSAFSATANAIKEHFPDLYKTHRGQLTGAKYGF